MALKPQFEEYLKTLTPEVAKVMREMAEKAPELQDGFLRQSDYDRVMNETKKDKEAFEVERTEWQGWHARNKQKFEQMSGDYEKVLEEKNKLAEQVQAAAASAGAAAGAPVDSSAVMKQVEERLKGAGYVSKADVAAIVAEEAAKVAEKKISDERAAFYSTTFPRVAQFNAELVEVMQDHFIEFGQKIDRSKFGQYMKDNQITSPKEGYEKFVNDARQAKKNEAEVSKRVDEELKKRSKDNFPGATPNAPDDRGALEIRLNAKSDSDVLFNTKSEIGDGSAAAMAAAELQAEGKA